MRRVFVVAVLAPIASLSCAGGGSGPAGTGMENVFSGGGQAGTAAIVVAAPNQGGGAGVGATGTPAMMAGAGGMAPAATTGTMGGGSAGMGGATSTGTTGTAGMDAGGSSGAAPTGTTETGGAGGGGGQSSMGGMMSSAECTDVPDPEQTCATRLEWGNCEQQWLIDGGFCQATCGHCESGGGTAGSGSGDGGSGNTGNTGATDTNNYSPLSQGNGVIQGNSTRYWDCCKQSCGWTGNTSMPVDSCDRGGNNIGVNDMVRNMCFDGGDGTTCHGMAPINTDKYSYGYAAANGAPCGSCWQLQFTGTSSNGGNDAGSAAINGKIMIVMATNIGDLNGATHFDLLIPGGGVGAAGSNACTTSLGVSTGDLGAERGGFLASCAGAGDHNAKKQCVRNMCDSTFANWPDLKAGCEWYVDWFEIADNPNFLAKQVDCPQQLREFN